MTDTSELTDPARHIDSDAEIVAKHANAEVDHVGSDYFNIKGTIDRKGFKAAQSKGYVPTRVMKFRDKPCTRFVLESEL